MSHNTGSKEKMVWVDLEMSGLDVDKERILQIAVCITDHELNNMVEGPCITVHQEDELLKNMDDWNQKAHGSTGLIAAVKSSKISESDAENLVLEFLSQHIKERRKCPLAGNSIYMDRIFIMKYMPRLDDFLHHRLIDVSSVKELAQRWAPQIVDSAPKKANSHQAIVDIKESIEELRHYKKHFFNI